jgi:hypothetical protein
MDEPPRTPDAEVRAHLLTSDAACRSAATVRHCAVLLTPPSQRWWGQENSCCEEEEEEEKKEGRKEGKKERRKEGKTEQPECRGESSLRSHQLAATGPGPSGPGP